MNIIFNFVSGTDRYNNLGDARERSRIMGLRQNQKVGDA
jgi:hypothetical protein